MPPGGPTGPRVGDVAGARRGVEPRARRTSRACGPFSLSTTSYVTRSPSASSVSPSASARTWTKTSSPPDSGVTNPKPLSTSYQDTVPSAPSDATACWAASAPSGSRWSACGPFSPSTTRNATRCPSETTPPPTMAELCTKISAPPPSGVMKPYPLAGSYQETVPSTPSGASAAWSPVTRTRRACGPRSPSPISNSTTCPSRSSLVAVVADDLGRVHEQVLAPPPEGDEAEPPLGVEPADGSLGHG